MAIPVGRFSPLSTAGSVRAISDSDPVQKSEWSGQKTVQMVLSTNRSVMSEHCRTAPRAMT